MEAHNITKKYSNGEITVIWKPALCQHSTRCFRGLPEVFNPMNKPWIDPMGAVTDDIISQIKMCPSGALSFVFNNSLPEDEAK